MRLTSTRNEQVRTAAALTRRRERRERGHHLVEGPHAVTRALAAGVVTTVFVATADGDDAHAVAAALLTDEPSRRLGDPASRQGPTGFGDDVQVIAVADHVLRYLADTRTPQGMVAVARDVTIGLGEIADDRLLVVLDRLAEPGNVGGIVRTADAADAAAVVCLQGTSDPLGPKAVRAAAGSTYHVPVVVGVEEDELLAHVRSRGRRLYGLEASSSRSVLDLDPQDGPVGLVLGNEAHGIDPRVRSRLDGLVAVPMLGRAESLNVAVAASIAIYASTSGFRTRGGDSR